MKLKTIAQYFFLNVIVLIIATHIWSGYVEMFEIQSQFLQITLFILSFAFGWFCLITIKMVICDLTEEE